MVKRYPRLAASLASPSPPKIKTSVKVKMGEADRFPRLKRFPRFLPEYKKGGSVRCICGRGVKFWHYGNRRGFCSDFCMYIHDIFTHGRTYPLFFRAEFHEYKARLRAKMAEGHDMEDAVDLLAKEDRRKERAINKGLGRQGRLPLPAVES